MSPFLATPLKMSQLPKWGFTHLCMHMYAPLHAHSALIHGPCIKAELSPISLVYLLVIKIHLDCCLARLNQQEIHEFRLKCRPAPRTWTNETCMSSPANSQSRFILIIKTEEWSSIASHRNCSSDTANKVQHEDTDNCSDEVFKTNKSSPTNRE